MSKYKKMIGPAQSLRTCLLIAGVTAALGACTHTSEDTTGAIVPNDYRLRHPIALQEADQATEVFVATGRGGLSGSQRADVAAMAQAWLREGTGTIIAEVPVDTPNARAAADSLREVRGVLAAAGVPARGFVVKKYHPGDKRQFATIRLSYPRLAAVAGPCGVWPDDLGSSINNKGYLDNKPYWNFGCASQRNLAAIVANPTDLVQPRPETPSYRARRTYEFERYRQGQPTATIYADTDKNRISNVGQ